MASLFCVFSCRNPNCIRQEFDAKNVAFFLFICVMDYRKQIIKGLSDVLLPERLEVLKAALSFRTRYITVAVENLYQPQNASAVLRTCDCFGIQNVNVIEQYNQYRVNPEIAMGADQWLTVKKYSGSPSVTLDAISDLRSAGYRIVATTTHTHDVSLPEFDLQKGKVALFFGTERRGLTKDVLDNADEFLRIPMYGFTESFNISVSVAIILSNLIERLHKSDADWHLSSADYDEVLLIWLLRTVKKSDLLVARLCEELKISPEPFVLPPTDVMFDHRY